ncbi:MAG: DUF3857 domain-containing protein [Bacteroidetes bacterium]|nr:DUF3857 domain-containing protein [Bacteroidota bacterium]
MNRIVSCIILSATLSAARAQKSDIELVKWEAKPALHTLNDRYQKESAVILYDVRRVEYADENKEVVAYKTIHRIIRINDDHGIEAFNQVYLGVTDNSDIIDIRARTILPGGRIIEIDRKNIKDRKEEDGSIYKMFAMEGLEKGCELEYYYTFKRDASFFGRELMQGKYPELNVQLQILSPERLIFEMKGYNCRITAIDTVLKGKRTLRTGQQDIPGAEEEKYAAYGGNLRRVEYKLSYNTAVSNGAERLFTWNTLAKRSYSIYSTYTDKEQQAAGDLVSRNKWDRLATDREKITTVENYLKKNFATREDIRGEDAANIEKIVKTRIASNAGIIRLYGAVYRKLGLDFQFVLTGDRSENIIDKSFENWNNTDNVMLYFPSTKKSMAPTLLQTRYPWTNPYWEGADALYCKGTTIGTFTTAIADIKNVPQEDYTKCFNNIEVSVSLDKNSDSLLIDLRELYSGYLASPYRAAFTFGSADDQKEIVKSLVKYCTNSEKIISSELQNQDFESFADDKPFILHAVVKSGDLVENAGNKLLLKVGELIGAQTEMYQEKPRQFPVQLPYAHVLDRSISFVIPDGYTAKNLSALNIGHTLKAGNDTLACFISNYKLEGNTVKITVQEEYRRLDYPMEQFEEFKKVINASADFNKVVLILEKK